MQRINHANKNPLSPQFMLRNTILFERNDIPPIFVEIVREFMINNSDAAFTVIAQDNGGGKADTGRPNVIKQGPTQVIVTKYLP